MSDEFVSYKGLDEFYTHQSVNHGAKEYVRGEIHTNSLEGAWSLMKRIFKGIYHRPSRKHMNAYTDEFEFRYNTRKKTMPQKFKMAVSQSGTRMKHADII